MFPELVESEFRRAAATEWAVGNSYGVEIRLVQYRQEEHVAAKYRAGNWLVPGTEDWPVPGTGDGKAYVTLEPTTKPGYRPVYKAEAHAWRGDIAMEIWIYSSKAIPKALIMDLAKRQMERL
jgi:hypothetical protein